MAYSGGLDTSVIVPWLKNNYDGCEVVCFTADLGQEEELTGLEDKAIKSGASKLYIRDLREEFLTQYVFPTMQAGAIYEREYLLGTSFARPLIAKHMVEVAELDVGFPTVEFFLSKLHLIVHCVASCQLRFGYISIRGVHGENVGSKSGDQRNGNDYP